MRGTVATLHSPEYTRFRAELVELRERAGFTQRALAAKLNMPHQWVGRSELGERRLDLLETMAWCHACGVDAGQFVSRLREQLGEIRFEALTLFPAGRFALAGTATPLSLSLGTSSAGRNSTQKRSEAVWLKGLLLGG